MTEMTCIFYYNDFPYAARLQSVSRAQRSSVATMQNLRRPLGTLALSDPWHRSTATPLLQASDSSRVVKHHQIPVSEGNTDMFVSAAGKQAEPKFAWHRLWSASCRHNPPLRHAWRARSVRCSNVAISVCVQAYKHASPGMGRQWLAGRVIQDVNVCCATFTGAADMAISPQSATTRSWLLAVAAGILLAGVTVLALNWHNERKDMVVLPVTGWPTQKPQRLGSPQVRHATVPHAYTDGSNQYDGNHHVSSRTNEQARLQPMPQPRAVEPAVALNVARPGAEDPVVFVTAVTREFVAHASCLVRSILKHVAPRASTGVHANVQTIVFDLGGAHDALNAALKQNSQRVSIRPFNISKAA